MADYNLDTNLEIYLRGVFIDISSISEKHYKRGKNIFGNGIVAVNETQHPNVEEFIFKNKNNVEPPMYYIKTRAKLVKSVGNYYEYILFGYHIKYFGVEGVFISAPVAKILDDMCPEKGVKFIGCSLDDLCHDQFFVGKTPAIKTTRISFKLEEEKDTKVSTITLWGDDVVSSQLLRDLVFSNNQKSKNMMIDKKISPFKYQDMHSYRRSLSPNSVRLTIDDGISPKFSLNIDKFGNYSFYLPNKDTSNSLLNILKYCREIESLGKIFLYNPLKRSESAIKEME